MAAAKLTNLARMTTPTTGAGATIALGVAVAGYLSFALSGVADGDLISYGIADGANSEVGTATYSATGPQLTGRTPTNSTNSNAAIALSGSAQIFICVRSEDYVSRKGDTIEGSIKVTSPGPYTAVQINCPAGAGSPIVQGMKNNLVRWDFFMGDGSAESGGNVGSDFIMRAFRDDGINTINPFGITRSNGLVTCYYGLTVNGGDLRIAKASPALILNKTSIAGGAIWGQYNGLNRWLIMPGAGDAETGGNAGSNFYITRYDDAGNVLSDVLSISRATGKATFTADLTIKTAAFPALALDAPLANAGAVVGLKNGVVRWDMIFGWGAESSGNAGSDFLLRSYTDAGATLGTPLTITRATAAMTLTGDLTINKTNPLIALGGAAGSQNHIVGRKGGLDRWTMQFGNNSAESGGNVGSDFALYRYNDAGGGAARAFGISRVTGTMTIDSDVLLGAGWASPPSLTPSSSPGAGNTTKGWTYRYNTTYGPEMYWNADSYGRIYIGQNVDGSLIYWTRSGVNVGGIGVTTTSTSYATSSDERLKEDLKSFDAGNIVDDTKVYDFAWKATGVRNYGVIAQQANQIYPAAVTYDKDKDWWGIDYSKYVPVILQELKALRARVTALEGAPLAFN
jgi:hypothetical protein